MDVYHFVMPIYNSTIFLYPNAYLTVQMWIKKPPKGVKSSLILFSTVFDWEIRR